MISDLKKLNYFYSSSFEILMKYKNFNESIEILNKYKITF